MYAFLLFCFPRLIGKQDKYIMGFTVCCKKVFVSFHAFHYTLPVLIWTFKTIFLKYFSSSLFTLCLSYINMEVLNLQRLSSHDTLVCAANPTLRPILLGARCSAKGKSYLLYPITPAYKLNMFPLVK